MEKGSNRNVYELALERLNIIFKEFDTVCVSFSGGKDSGVLLNLCMDYIRRNCPERKLCVFHMDYDHAKVRMIRQASIGIALISLLYLIPAGIRGCGGFESEFMRQKEAWPEVHQAELQRFLDYAFPGEPISVFVDTLCRNYNWKWMMMVILASLSMVFVKNMILKP